MKKITIVIITFFIGMSFMLNAFAGSSRGKIGRILVQQPHFVFFSTTGRISNRSSCQGGSEDFSIDISTELGQAQYAFVMMANGLNETIVVTGTGACNDFADRESVNFMFTRD